MASRNLVILIGNLGRDPELRYAQEGQPVCNFSIATTEKWKGKDGQQHEKTEWHSIVAWGKTAEICAEHLSKGSSVYIEGRIQSRKWEDKDKNERTSFEINAQVVQFLGGKSEKKEERKEEDSTPPDPGPIPF